MYNYRQTYLWLKMLRHVLAEEEKAGISFANGTG